MIKLTCLLIKLIAWLIAVLFLGTGGLLLALILWNGEFLDMTLKAIDSVWE